MELSQLIGNEALKRQLNLQAGRRGLSHAYILSGPAGSGKRTLAGILAAALVCAAPEERRPCLACAACRKAAGGIHPDIVRIGEDGKEIPVSQVRALRSDAYIRPNEGRRKVYIFPDCGLLTEQDQNVLLKIVEEGPPYAAFLFCAENPAAVLQTLRSRCVELRPGAAAGGTDGALSESAERLCRCLGSKKRGSAAELAARLEKKRTTREDLSAFLEECQEAFSAALLLLYGQPPGENLRESASFLAKNLTKSQIVRTIEVLQKYRGECAYNVGPGHVLGALAVELEEIF